MNNNVTMYNDPPAFGSAVFQPQKVCPWTQWMHMIWHTKWQLL